MSDIDAIIRMKDRLRIIEIEAAKLEERKAAAEARLQEAKDKLRELGVRPEHAEDEVDALYDKCLEQLAELEELLDIRNQ